MSDQTTFGEPPMPPHVRAAAQAKPKVHAQPGDSTQLNRPARPRVAIVDSDREIPVQVLYSTIVFRPNQRINPEKEPRLLQTAIDNDIPLRYQE